MKMIIWILPVILLTGCAGSRCLVTARTIEPPVSFTACVLDSAGRIRTAGTNEVLRHFVLTRDHWSMCYTLIHLDQKEWDISQELNSQIKEAGGNAAVNVTVRAKGGDCLLWYFGALVPIIPCYVDVTVEGDIAKFSDETQITEDQPAFRLDAPAGVPPAIPVSNVFTGYMGTNQPPLSSAIGNSANGLPVLQLTGKPGFNYALQASPVHFNWTNKAIAVNTNGVVPFIVPDPTNYSQQSYRAVAPH